MNNLATSVNCCILRISKLFISEGSFVSKYVSTDLSKEICSLLANHSKSGKGAYINLPIIFTPLFISFNFCFLSIFSRYCFIYHPLVSLDLFALSKFSSIHVFISLINFNGYS